ncbi:hypothetical protein CBR_g17617 [Chara braunii]|uniref:Integrase catalytic domain-containing protein n=1 Tax=Chara braunii TaxID=69332 RepID=A0A388KVD3_CHABU|nr:hypothetical protein CBR_g17617 [Chara braunii]|eukprot:GBG73903.1 hypothetical protein CBR_g17617 [Chara braunii]
MQRRQEDVSELEDMDPTQMDDDDVRTIWSVPLSVVEIQDHQTEILQDIQQSLAVLVGRMRASPSPSGPGAWPVAHPPPFVPLVTGVSPYVAPSSVAIVSLGMQLSGGLSSGPSLQVPVQPVYSQPSLQIAITTQPAVSQPVQPQGTQALQPVQPPVSHGPQPSGMQGPGQTQWVPKTAIVAPKPFTGDKRGKDLDTWLRAMLVYVKCKLTLPHEEVLVAASYLEGSATRWLSGLVQLQGYGHDFRAWAVTQQLDDFVKLVEERWHDPQEAQKATNAIQTLHMRQFKSVREATDTVERLICVPGVHCDPQVLLTSYLRCFPMPLRNQLAGEANINVHNFPSFSKKALDLEAKGRIMFVDNDGSTIELDDNFREGVGSEAGSIEALGGGVVAVVAQKGPRDSVSIDFMDTKVKSRNGKSQVMVIVDRFSKFAVFVALPAEAKTDLVIREFFKHWVEDYGHPLTIVSDRDSRFTNEQWQQLMSVYGSKLTMSPGRHPETNGQTEQMNKLLQQTLRMYIRPDQIDWDEHLPKVASVYNNSMHLTTCRTPMELHLGWNPRRPIDCLNPDRAHKLSPGTRELAMQYQKDLEKVKENIIKAQHQMIEQANNHRRRSQFAVGGLVWVKSKEFIREENISQKLLPTYRGPWQVLDVIGDVDGPSYVIEIPPHLHTYPVFHASKLLPCVTSELFPNRRSATPPSMDGKFDVDRIIVESTLQTGRRGRPQRQYQVRFAYQDPSEHRWYTREELIESAPDIVTYCERAREGVNVVDI